MLFNSYLFLFLFLPVTLIGYYLIGKFRRPRLVIFWLVAASLVFYGWSIPLYPVLLAASVLANYLLGSLLARASLLPRRRLLLAVGILFNILLLGYFKYANFFLDSANALLSTGFHVQEILLPLAISFFTIQQIAALVDLYRGEAKQYGFLEYSFFVAYFPKLLAGPIVRLHEMMPQILTGFTPRITTSNLAVGLTTLGLGLFKKVVLADGIGAFVAPIFQGAGQGMDITFVNAWIGALAYTFQIYFDFSGYTDMAIGISLLFGLRLPLNFYSPYKASSIIDFWRRWHMTLSSFIRDYIYIPLGGNRHGFLRQMIYLLIAMAVAGLWHGAAWTFVIWGALHGLYLVINHAWRKIFHTAARPASRWGTALSTVITFLAVAVAWVFFNSDSLGSALVILQGMAGLHGIHLPAEYLTVLSPVAPLLQNLGVVFDTLPGFSLTAVAWILISLVICWFLPNVQEFMADFRPSLNAFPEKNPRAAPRFWRWKPAFLLSVALGCLTALAILGLSHVSQFIYFRF